jgi:hypothetical protein
MCSDSFGLKMSIPVGYSEEVAGDRIIYTFL